MTKQPDLLTPEERDLADRLGRIAPRGTPSAALDARILGAAHAAAGRKAGPARPRSQWPALVGIAATVALAVGVVWQLRPVHEVPTVRDETPTSAVIRPQPTAAASEEAAPVSESDLGRPAEPRTADIAAPAQPSEPRLRMLSPPAPSAPPAPAPPPPPPSVPTPTRAAAAAADRSAAAAQSRYQAAPKAAAMQRKATGASAIESAATDVQADSSTGIDDGQHMVTIADVPIDSDRLLDPVDWIERIRQRRDSGDLDSARASLGALREAHPAMDLPEDVLAIATVSAMPPER